MKQLLPALFLSLLFSFSCQENTPRVIFSEEDSSFVAKERIDTQNILGNVPGMDAEVIDYTSPSPYQHKPQLLRDSTQSMSWDQAGFPDGKSFILFFKQFQFDVIDRNKELIADLIHFPIRGFKNRTAFINAFDSVFGKEFVEEIVHQDPMEIYRNKNGAMIGDDGQIWFKLKGDKYQIVEINP